MSFPLVVSAMKIHSIQVRKMRHQYLEKAYLKNYNLTGGNFQPYINSSAMRIHRKKKNRTEENRTNKNAAAIIKREPEGNSMAGKENTDSKTHRTSVVKNKRKCHKKCPSAAQFTKNEVRKKGNWITDAKSVTVCSARKLLTSYSSNSISLLQHIGSNTSTEVKPRAKTGVEKIPPVSGSSETKQSSSLPAFQSSLQGTGNVSKRFKKIYYSERQSHVITGAPCVPPASPTNDNVDVDIVPSLADIKSQQLIKSRLRSLLNQRQKAEGKLRDKILKEEKRKARQDVESLQQQRRLEIYALNDVMRENERNNFMKSMKEKHGTTSTPIALNILSNKNTS